MQIQQLANEIRLFLNPSYREQFRNLDDEQVIRESVVLPESGKPVCTSDQLFFSADRADSLEDFQERIAAFWRVGTLNDREQSLVQAVLDKAIWQAVGNVVLDRGGEGQEIPQHIVTALLYEVGVFAKAYYRNADR